MFRLGLGEDKITHEINTKQTDLEKPFEFKIRLERKPHQKNSRQLTPHG